MTFFFVNVRRQYLSNAVLQAKNASDSGVVVGSTRGAMDTGLLDLLEGKLAVLRFQIKIKDELEAIASRLQSSSDISEAVPNGSAHDSNVEAEQAKIAREKAKELSLDLKSITQLYNEYAVPFELWEVNLFLPNPQEDKPIELLYMPVRLFHVVL
jgi:nuclear pore complex protein Nup155